MNLLYPEIKVTTSRDCASFLFQDITPAYNFLSAPNGYDPTGANCVNPNNLDPDLITVEVTNVTTSTSPVIVTIPSSAFDPTAIPGIVNYQITSSILGSTISDGVYKFTYTVVDMSDNNRIYNRTCYMVSDCNICCTLEQMLKDLKTCGTCNDKNTKTTNKLYEAYMLRAKAHHLAACHDFAGAKEVLDYLTTLLDIKTCDSCN